METPPRGPLTGDAAASDDDAIADVVRRLDEMMGEGRDVDAPPSVGESETMAAEFVGDHLPMLTGAFGDVLIGFENDPYPRIVRLQLLRP